MAVRVCAAFCAGVVFGEERNNTAGIDKAPIQKFHFMSADLLATGELITAGRGCQGSQNWSVESKLLYSHRVIAGLCAFTIKECGRRRCAPIRYWFRSDGVPRGFHPSAGTRCQADLQIPGSD